MFLAAPYGFPGIERLDPAEGEAAECAQRGRVGRKDTELVPLVGGQIADREGPARIRDTRVLRIVVGTGPEAEVSPSTFPHVRDSV